jgi:hypothetical protein
MRLRWIGELDRTTEGGSKELSQHKAFMNQCLEGKIPLSGGTAAAARGRADRAQ